MTSAGGGKWPANRRPRMKKRRVSPAIPRRIVTPRKRAPEPVEHAEAGAEATRDRPRIVTAKARPSPLGPVHDQEHQRRADAAEALFRELSCGVAK